MCYVPECLGLIRVCCRLSAVEIRLYFDRCSEEARAAPTSSSSSSSSGGGGVLAKRTWDPRAIVPRAITTLERAAAAVAATAAAEAAFVFSVCCIRLMGLHAEALERGPISAQALVCRILLLLLLLLL